jgi:acetoacetate decarboxylase
MGYVKTPQEVARTQGLLSAGSRFQVESLSLEFETTAEFVREVLPPCFAPVETPRALARVSCWRSDQEDFDSAIVGLIARYGELEGFYTLLMVLNGDMPVTRGRELWGEVKKTGSARLYHLGGAMYGYGERNGTRLVEIEAELGPDLGPETVEGHSLEVKAFPTADGAHLQYDPLMLAWHARSAYTNVREGTGRLTLTGTPWDPVDTIPVVRTGLARHTIGTSLYRCVREEVLPDRDAYLPYVYGRHYDDLLIGRDGRVLP